MRLDDEKEDDEAAEHHELEVRHGLDGDVQPQHGWRVAQQNRQQHDEGSAQERAENRAQAADDDHEEHLERAVDLEGQRDRQSVWEGTRVSVSGEHGGRRMMNKKRTMIVQSKETHTI